MSLGVSTRLYAVCSIVAYCIIIFHYAHNSRHLNITHINIKPIHVSNQRKNKRRERIELAKNKDKINNNYIYGEGGGENDVVEIRPIRSISPRDGHEWRFLPNDKFPFSRPSQHLPHYHTEQLVNNAPVHVPIQLPS